MDELDEPESPSQLPGFGRTFMTASLAPFNPLTDSSEQPQIDLTGFMLSLSTIRERQKRHDTHFGASHVDLAKPCGSFSHF